MKIGSRVKLAPGVKAGDEFGAFEVSYHMIFKGLRTVRDVSETTGSLRIFNHGITWYYPKDSLVEVQSPETPGIYVITGKNKEGKRFPAIRTTTPQHYNIWCGTIWHIQSNGARKRVKTIYN